LVLIPEDQFHIDLKTVPNNDKEVFNLKFTLIQDEIGKTISKTEAFVIQREIALDQLMVKNGVTDLISGKHVILNEGDVIIPEEILYNEKPYFITSIGSSAFYMNKAITSIKIPESIKSIEYEAFYYCENLKGELILPKTLNYIGRFAFYYGSGLTGNLVIPDSVTSIGNYAFLSCDSLEKIIIQGKSEGEITGSPWGAPDTVTIEWQPSQEGA
jgi:cell surface protein